MDKRKNNQKGRILLSAIIAVFFALCALVTLFPNTLASATETKVEVNTVASGKVSLGELCLRHDVLYAIMPGGAAYADTTNDPLMKDMINSGRLVAYDTADMLFIREGTLLGYRADYSVHISDLTKVLLVIPKSVKKIEYDIGAENIAGNSIALAGIVFEEGSTLSAITEPMFKTQSNVRFLILPESVKTIGNRNGEPEHGVFAWNQLQDVVMPGVESIGSSAFYGACSLHHITIPKTVKTIDSSAFVSTFNLCDVENNSDNVSNSLFPYALNIYGESSNNSAGGKSYLHILESFGLAPITDEEKNSGTEAQRNREVNNSLVFSYNNLRNSVLAQTSSTTVNYAKKWYFIGIDGIEDKNLDLKLGQTTEYHLPERIDLTEPRVKITYDYLGSDGTKFINGFTEVAADGVPTDGAVDRYVTKYDIGFGANYNRAMTRIFLPQADVVTNIGNYAFLHNQCQLVDISGSVRVIGHHAFRGSHRVKVNSTIYIRHTADEQLDLGNYVFAVGAAWNYDHISNPGMAPTAQMEVTRTIIFADKTSYEAQRNGNDSNLRNKFNKAGDNSVRFSYLIPVNTIVVDGNEQDKNFIRYALYGYTFMRSMNDDMKWTDKGSTEISLPVLDGFKWNQWYQEDEFTNKVSEKFSDINDKLTSGADEINLYTKSVATPDFSDHDYTYDKEVSLSDSFTYQQALQFSDENNIDYDVKLNRFVDFNNNVSTPDQVGAAGAYTLKVILNEKWGEWDDNKVYTYSVTVARAEIDLGDVKNVPEFVTDSGTPLGGTGDGVPLYEYIDGWYLFAKGNDNKDPSVKVVNSYARYTGDEITISAAQDDTRKYRVVAGEGINATQSGRRLASFTFIIDDPNYVFVNKSLEENRSKFERLGITYTNISAEAKDVTTVNVAKYWYIVIQQNWLADAEYTGDVETGGNYVMLTCDGEPVTSFRYESTFGSGSGEYKLHIPKLAKGESNEEITFSIVYGNNEPITMDANGNLTTIAIDHLPRYINSAMPVGNYTITIYAGEAVELDGNKLPAVSEVVKLSVTNGHLDVEDIIGMLTGEVKDATGAILGNTFEHVYSVGKVFMFDDEMAQRLSNMLADCDTRINTVRKTTTSEWANSVYDKYYDSLKIAYNLDRMQTSEYYSSAKIAQFNLSRVPSEVGQYIVYYSLSARNYAAIGGANAANRRDYRFNTIIYREITTEAFKLGGTIKNIEYSGTEQYPNIPYSQYYTYNFIEGEDYINAGEKKIIFTINNPILTRWSDKNKPNNVTLEPVEGESGKYTAVATVVYNIERANNDWYAAPQMPSWSFNGFDLEINTIVSSLKFSNSDTVVTYYIVGTDGRYLSKDGLTFTDVEDDYFSFRVTLATDEDIDAIGRVIDEDGSVVKILNALKPGRYYLASRVSGNSNIKEFVTPDSQRNRLVITKAQNTWTSTPSVNRWAWGSYNKSENIISATSLYPNYLPYEGFDIALYTDASGKTPLVTYSIVSKVGTVEIAIEGLENFHTVDDVVTVGGVQMTVAQILAELPAGSYILYTRLDGTDYYMPIARSGHEFNISQAVNSWSTTPNVIRWSWGAYDRNINLINAVAEYSSAYEDETAPIVKFTVLDSAYGKIDGLVNFTVTDGVVDSAEVANLLGELPAGTYYLVASLEGRRNYRPINNKAISAVGAEGAIVAYDFDNVSVNRTLNPVEFIIGIAVNYWEMEPSMTSWQYNAFVDITNFVNGVPHYPLEGKQVTYGLRKSAPSNPIVKPVAATEADNTGYIFVFEELNEDVAAYLKALEVGSYWFVAYVDGEEGMYNSLSMSASFSVTMVVTNYWENGMEPSVSGWAYKKFETTGGSVTAGVPILGDADKSLYTVEKQSDGNENNFVSISGYAGLTYEQLIANFKSADETLGAGNYRLIVVSESSGNFASVTRELRFTVSKDINAWKDGVEPSIAGWTYGEKPNEPTEVAAEYEEAQVSYEYYKAILRDSVWVATGEAINIDETSGVGDYIMVTTVAATSNYAELVHIAYFRIEKYQDGGDTVIWTNADALAVGIVRWTYGEADISKLPEPSVNRGTLKYTYNGSSSGELSAWSLLADFDAGEYTITATIFNEDGYPLDVPSYIVTLIVEKKVISWTNEPNQAEYEWNFGADSNPQLPMLGVDNWKENGEIVYTVYLEDGSSQELVDDPLTAEKEDDWNVWLSKQGVGKYRFTATVNVKDNDPNYTELNFTVNVTIKKFVTSWQNESDLRIDPITWIYGSDDYTKVAMPVPNWSEEGVVYSYSNDVRRVIISAGGGKTIVEAWNNALRSLGYGTYTFKAHVEGDRNHTALDYLIVVTVERADNEWLSSVITDLEADKIAWAYGAKDVDVAFRATKFNETLEIRVNGSRINAAESSLMTRLNEYLSTLSYGTYTLIATVPQNDYYNTLTETITITVIRSENEWITQMEIGSDGVAAADGEVAEHGWTWDNQRIKDNIFTVPVSAMGKEVIITVYRLVAAENGTVTERVISTTIAYRIDENERIANANDVRAFLTQLFALDMGEYRIFASIAATNDFEALESEGIDFVVKQANNEWIKLPKVETLEYGTNAPNPESKAKYGSVDKYEYAYAKDGEGNDIAYEDVKEWFDSAPINAGDYYVRGVIESTLNYAALEGYSKYSIGAGANVWVNAPGVIAWSWNHYDRVVNRFSGSARSNGKVTFGIRKGTIDNMQMLSEDVDFYNFDGSKITTQQRELLSKFELQSGRYVSDDIAAVLNALKPGTYILVVDVEGGESLAALHGTATFVVSKADNEWNSVDGQLFAPNILSFVYNEFEVIGDRANFSAGVAKYGVNNVLYRVVGDDNDNHPVDSGIVGLNENAIRSYIDKLAAGNYSLQAWVIGGETYNAYYNAVTPYSVLFRVSRAQNAWAENNEPAEHISIEYSDLQKLSSFETWFAEPKAISNTATEFDVLDSRQRVVRNGLTYQELFDELKSLDYGSYFIRSNVPQSCNYMSITKNTAVAISRQANKLLGISDKSEIQAQWRMTKTENGYKVDNDLSQFTEITAVYGNVTYMLQGFEYTYEELVAYLKTVDVGKYNVTVWVDETNDYEGCAEAVVAVNVIPADNGWIESWNISSSLMLGDTAVVSWKWASKIKWVGGKPIYGSTINVMIARRDKADNALYYFTIDTTTNFAAQSATVGEALSELGYGEYIITVTAPAGKNWNALNDTELTTLLFSVTRTENFWTKEPSFVNAGGEVIASNKWDYSAAVMVRAQAKYGDYTVEFFDFEGGTKGESYTQLPTEVGRYIAVFSVEQTDEYDGLYSEVEFSIDKILNESFTVVTGVVPWTWDSYNRFYNLFTGIAASGGKVSYAIMQDGAVVEVDGVKLENIELVDEHGVHHGDPSMDIYVPEATAKLIAKLLGGEYVLRVSFAETANYKAFTSMVDFKIATARNEWVVAPHVSPWTEYNWTASQSTPQARSLYGNPTITITGQADKVVYYRATFDPVKGEYVEDRDTPNMLNRAPAGWYTMRTTVEAEEGKYDNRLDSSLEFQIFIYGSPDARNYWIITPNIKPWNANLNGEYGEITGKPVRGLPYFVFYHAVMVDGELTLGDMVVAGEDSVTVEAGSIYYKDFYVPMAPGQYFMVAHAEYEVGGKIVTSDSLVDTPRLFEIGNRENTFEQDARIATILYLGEKSTWQQPTAKATLPDSVITFTYRDAVTNELLGTEIPTVPGNYYLTATATAKYSNPITSRIEFAVRLSQNSWVNDVSPTIESWSEEYSDNAPDPVGEARYGTIVYTYVDLREPNITLNEKPLTQGNYILIATVELDGYATLESRCEFTVYEPFDSLLIWVDIILGLIACAFTIVVIIFAVRRYKENG